MSDFELTKHDIARQIKGLCAHCSSGTPHQCQVSQLANKVIRLSGVPLIVNNRFEGILRPILD